jgi:hypothetical protein
MCYLLENNVSAILIFFIVINKLACLEANILCFICRIHIYYSRFIPEGITKTSQIFLRDAFYQNDNSMRNTADVTGGKPIAYFIFVKVWAIKLS